MTQTLPDKWAKPQQVDDVTLVFPANVVGTLLPEWSEIPEAFREGDDPEVAPWEELQRLWFFAGVGVDAKFYLSEGVDGNEAIRHLSAIQRSFEPKHEHKVAGVAWLASLWFEAVRWFSADGTQSAWLAPEGVEEPEAPGE